MAQMLALFGRSMPPLSMGLFVLSAMFPHFFELAPYEEKDLPLNQQLYTV